jgi:hypothetical protein
MGWRDREFMKMMAMANGKKKRSLFKKLSTGRKVEAEKDLKAIIGCWA